MFAGLFFIATFVTNILANTYYYIMEKSISNYYGDRMFASPSGSKGIFSALLLIMAFFVSTMPASAYDFKYNGVLYNINTDGLTVSVTHNDVDSMAWPTEETAGYSGAVTIPQTVTYNGNTYTVTSIGRDAFTHCTLTSVSLPTTIRYIGHNPFNRSTLTTPIDFLNIPITRMFDNFGLYGTGDDNIFVHGTQGLAYIGTVAKRYYGTMPADGVVVVRDGTTQIAAGCFDGYTDLKVVKIPATVQSIGNVIHNGSEDDYYKTGAFNGCTSLTDVYVYWNSPITITDNQFPVEGVTLHVPEGTESNYTGTDNWNSFPSQKLMESQSVNFHITKQNTSGVVLLNDSTYIQHIVPNTVVPAPVLAGCTLNTTASSSKSIMNGANITIASGLTDVYLTYNVIPTQKVTFHVKKRTTSGVTLVADSTYVENIIPGRTITAPVLYGYTLNATASGSATMISGTTLTIAANVADVYLTYDENAPAVSTTLPFVPTTIVKGKFSMDTHWYAVTINGKYMQSSAKYSGNRFTTNAYSLVSAPSTFTDEYLWAFVGDNTSGLKIYNRATGVTMTLNSATSKTYTYATMSTGTATTYHLVTSSRTNTYSLLSGSSNYLNDYNSRNALGLSFSYTTNTATFTQKALESDKYTIKDITYHITKKSFSGATVSETTSTDKMYLNYAVAIPTYEGYAFDRANSASASLVDDNGQITIPAGISDVYLTYVAPQRSYNLTVSAAQYTTLDLDFPINIPTGVICYRGEKTAADAMTLRPISSGILPANTPVVINAPQGIYTLNEATSQGTAIIGNAFSGTPTEAVEAPANSYVFNLVDGVVGFYRYTGTIIPAHKAYLVVPAGSNIRIFFGTCIDCITTGINTVDTAKNATIYDLQGRKAAVSFKGFGIVNGKKILK